MIYFKEDYVTVCYNEDLKLVEVEWNGLILSRYFRETLEMVLDLINEKSLENFLVNRKNMFRISLEDEQWRRESWFPRFIKRSIKRSASVISRDFYNEVSFSKLIEEEDKDITIERKRFYKYSEAKEWLVQKIKSEV